LDILRIVIGYSKKKSPISFAYGAQSINNNIKLLSL